MYQHLPRKVYIWFHTHILYAIPKSRVLQRLYSPTPSQWNYPQNIDMSIKNRKINPHAIEVCFWNQLNLSRCEFLNALNINHFAVIRSSKFFSEKLRNFNFSPNGVLNDMQCYKKARVINIYWEYYMVFFCFTPLDIIYDFILWEMGRTLACGNRRFKV